MFSWMKSILRHTISISYLFFILKLVTFWSWKSFLACVVQIFYGAKKLPNNFHEWAWSSDSMYKSLLPVLIFDCTTCLQQILTFSQVEFPRQLQNYYLLSTIWPNFCLFLYFRPRLTWTYWLKPCWDGPEVVEAAAFVNQEWFSLCCWDDD